ncbi:hypothetical protein IAR55_005552 [Kwoniella newhampshirensis]|uniref:Zn(2)-C6 fungal-type domain-containing protein n=1 Tax=Kwoniella newhampshirensis TaxID=1651941 RepID=A0AAW0YTZ9_9TREE
MPMGAVQRGTVSMPTSPLLGHARVNVRQEKDVGQGGRGRWGVLPQTAQGFFPLSMPEESQEQPQTPQHVSLFDVSLPPGSSHTWLSPASPTASGAVRTQTTTNTDSPTIFSRTSNSVQIQTSSPVSAGAGGEARSTRSNPTSALALGPAYESDDLTSPHDQMIFGQDRGGEADVRDEVEGISPGGRKKRVQVRIACTHCQRACKKCSNTRPCERCVKYRLDDCVDSTRKPRKSGVKRGPYKRRASKYAVTGEYSTDPRPKQPQISVPTLPSHQGHPSRLQAKISFSDIAIGNNAQQSLSTGIISTSTDVSRGLLIHSHDDARTAPQQDSSFADAQRTFSHRLANQASAHAQHIPTYPPDPRFNINTDGIVNTTANDLTQALSAALSGPRWIDGQRLDLSSSSSSALTALGGEATRRAEKRSRPSPLYPKTPTGHFPISLRGDRGDPFSRAVSPIRQLSAPGTTVDVSTNLGWSELGKNQVSGLGGGNIPPSGGSIGGGTLNGGKMSGHGVIILGAPEMFNGDSSLAAQSTWTGTLDQAGHVASPESTAIVTDSSSVQQHHSVNLSNTTSKALFFRPHHNVQNQHSTQSFEISSKIRRPSLRTLISQSNGSSRAPSPVKSNGNNGGIDSPTLFDQPMNLDEGLEMVGTRLHSWKGWEDSAVAQIQEESLETGMVGQDDANMRDSAHDFMDGLGQVGMDQVDGSAPIGFESLMGFSTS